MNSRKFETFDVMSLYWYFEESKNGKGKFRPAVITGFSSDGKAIISKITSKYENKSPFIKLRYYPIKNLAKAGLDRPSYIDIKSQRKIKTSKLKKRGSLDVEDIRGLANFKKSYANRVKKFQIMIQRERERRDRE